MLVKITELNCVTKHFFILYPQIFLALRYMFVQLCFCSNKQSTGAVDFLKINGVGAGKKFSHGLFLLIHT